VYVCEIWKSEGGPGTFFTPCRSLSSITFESNSLLTRIESFAFSSSSIESIEIPRNVRFIEGSAFSHTSLSSISIESGNETFVIEREFFIDIIHDELIRTFSKSLSITIPSDVEILGSSCFAHCQSFSSISFESNSRLTRIESFAFAFSF
jgi:hypothetical protein